MNIATNKEFYLLTQTEFFNRHLRLEYGLIYDLDETMTKEYNLTFFGGELDKNIDLPINVLIQESNLILKINDLKEGSKINQIASLTGDCFNMNVAQSSFKLKTNGIKRNKTIHVNSIIEFGSVIYEISFNIFDFGIVMKREVYEIKKMTLLGKIKHEISFFEKIINWIK